MTGAAAGLARGISLALAREGYDIVFTYRGGGRPPAQTRELLAAEGFASHAYPVEFLKPAVDVAQELGEVASAHAIDILVHAVGPMTVRGFERSTIDDYHAMMDGNFRSAVQTAMALLPGMRERRFGRLVFFGLNGSQFTQPARGLTLHAAAKAALVTFARSLALEEGRHGITVNVVEPGDIRDKERTRAQARDAKATNPVGRPGTWEDVADAVRFLVREDSDFLNGVVLNVAGGLAEVYERNADGP